MSDDNILTRALDAALTRRSFLKWSSVLGGTVALADGLDFGLKAIGQNAPLSANAASGEGKWVTAACWHNCGGRCMNKAYVVDGVVTKQKTDDTHPDSPDYPQQRGCARGRSCPIDPPSSYRAPAAMPLPRSRPRCPSRRRRH